MMEEQMPPQGSNPFDGIPQQQAVPEAMMQPPQQAYMQEAPIPQSQVQQPIPPQQFVQQPQVMQQQLPDVIPVSIRLVEGVVVDTNVQGIHIDKFLKEISEAIDNQSTFQVGNRVINGRYIIFYTF